MEYTVVTYYFDSLNEYAFKVAMEKFEEKVQRKINEGWRPQGGVATSCHGHNNFDTMIYQAMTRKKKKVKKREKERERELKKGHYNEAILER